MTGARKFLWIGIALTALIFMLLGGWVWVLASQEPLHNPLARIMPWPVACTTRGCVTTQTWAQQAALDAYFAQTVGQEAARLDESLTTVVRRHLIAHAFVVEPITAADARRYREEILHLKDDAIVQAAVGVTAEEYDRLMIVPFLQQAAVQQQRKAESPTELYRALAGERWVIILPFSLRWDTDTGSVVRR